MRLGVSFFVSGLILTVFGVSMLIPGTLDFVNGSPFANAFWLSSAITCFFGALFMLMFYDDFEKLTGREMYLTVTTVWLSVCSFCALPFYFAPVPLNFTDSFFEAMSGLTTMGATVYPTLSGCSHGILLWRAMLHWIGGLGIIVIALAILPMLRVGGMQMFSMESSDKSGKNMPKTSQVVGTLMLVYVCATIVCLGALALSGLSAFDSVAYAMSTVASGGFAPYDSSAGALTPLQQWIVIFFMFISGLPLFFLYFVCTGNREKIKNDTQVKTYVGIILALSAAIAAYMVFAHPERPLENIVRNVLFGVLAIITTAGFTTEDYMLWGAFPVAVFFFLTGVGGCSGSTTGGIKIFRFNILYFSALKNLRNKILPHGIFITKFNGEPVTQDVTDGVFLFFSIFLIVLVLSSLALSLCGLDLLTALSGSMSALGNVGPAISGVIGPANTYAALPKAAKWIMSLDMMLGRLEYMAVLVLLLPLAWRKDKSKRSWIAF